MNRKCFITMRIAVGLTVAGCLVASAQGPSKTVRGDNSGLPMVDYGKTFDMKSEPGFNNDFPTRTLDLKAASLPEYSGNLKPLPMTQWTSSRSDLYPRHITPRDFEVRRTMDA